MSAGARTAEEIDTLSSLEERITRAVELVIQLRAEKQSLEAELHRTIEERDGIRVELNLAQTDASSAHADADASKAHSERLNHELEELHSERKQVRSRIEKLLGQMEVLSGA